MVDGSIQQRLSGVKPINFSGVDHLLSSRFQRSDNLSRPTRNIPNEVSRFASSEDNTYFVHMWTKALRPGDVSRLSTELPARALPSAVYPVGPFFVRMPFLSHKYLDDVQDLHFLLLLYLIEKSFFPNRNPLFFSMPFFVWKYLTVGEVDDWYVLRGLFVRRIYFVIYLSFPGVCRYLFQFFFCDTFPDGIARLEFDTSRTCYSSTW